MDRYHKLAGDQLSSDSDEESKDHGGVNTETMKIHKNCMHEHGIRQLENDHLKHETIGRTPHANLYRDMFNKQRKAERQSYQDVIKRKQYFKIMKTIAIVFAVVLIGTAIILMLKLLNQK